jgi:excisionase family DNA binding protein
MTESALLTYREAASLLGIRVATLYSMISRREIPHVRLGRRMVRFDRTDLLAWVGARRVAARAGSDPLPPTGRP